MRFTPTIFSKLIEPLDRRLFEAIVQRHDGDAYDKSFHSWDHLLALIFAQLSDLDSLRALEAGWNEEPIGPDYAAQAAPHYFNYRKVSIYGGSNEIQKNIIAKAILGL